MPSAPSGPMLGLEVNSMSTKAAGQGVSAMVRRVLGAGAAPGAEAARGDGRPVARAAAISFVLGLFALRICWLPGINLLLALGSLGFGIAGALQVAGSRGRLGGMEEAATGIVLGVVVLGLSVFFGILLIASLR